MTESARSEGTAPGDFSVRMENLGGAVVVSVAGEVDMATAPAVEESIKTALEQNPAVLVVDLSEVSFLASAGMSVLISGRQQARERTGFRLVAAGNATLRPMELTGIAEVFNIHPTRDQALSGS